MHLIVFASILATSFAALRGYTAPLPHGSNGNGASPVFPPVHSNGAPSNGAAPVSNGHFGNGAPASNGHFGNGAPASNGHFGNGAPASNGHFGNGAPASNGHFGNGNGRAEPRPQYGPPPTPSNGSPTNGKFNGHGVFEQRFEESSGVIEHDLGIPLPSVGSNGAAPEEFPQDHQAGGFEQGFGGDVTVELESAGEEVTCPENQVLGSDGICVEAEVSKTIYVYSAPERAAVLRSEIPQPKPKLNYNIVFVRAPEDSEDDQPIVVPPPQQKTIVYVLSKDSDGGEQQIIEVPSGPEHKPEVFYISYVDGENPQLPLGLDLETALASAVSQEGKAVEIEKEISGDDLSGDIEIRVQVEGEGDADFQAEDTGFGATNGFSTNGAAANGASNGYPTNGVSNGHQTNGATNGVAANGAINEIKSNGAANGFIANGGATNGFSSNGAINGFSAHGSTNGFSSNGAATNGYTSNGAATNGFSSNGAATNGFAGETGIPLPAFERQNGQPAQPAQPSGLYNTPSRRRI